MQVKNVFKAIEWPVEKISKDIIYRNTHSSYKSQRKTFNKQARSQEFFEDRGGFWKLGHKFLLVLRGKS